MNPISSIIQLLFNKKNRKTEQEKKLIRKEIKAQKLELSENERKNEALSVFRKIELLPEFKSADSIFMYWSLPDELPTHEIISKWMAEKFIILPTIKGDKLVLKRFISTDNLIQRTLGIWEPDLTETYTGKIDLIIVPGVAFDRKKNRLGRGKGYYDRFFKNNKAFRIGVGFDCQLLDSIPIDRFDKKMDLIITKSNTIQ